VLSYGYLLLMSLYYGYASPTDSVEEFNELILQLQGMQKDVQTWIDVYGWVGILGFGFILSVFAFKAGHKRMKLTLPLLREQLQLLLRILLGFGC